MAKPKATFVFKEAYAKAKKIAIRNQTLGKLIKLDKEQVRRMAIGGRLTSGQVAKMFEPETVSVAPAKDQQQE